MRTRMVAAGFVTAAVALVATASVARADAPVTAAPDDVQTTVNTPVDFDPTANDTIAPGFIVDHVEIESDPNYGTATVNSDNKTINYVPDTDYVGPDAMEYNIIVCANERVAGPRIAQQCSGDTGEISIMVDPAPQTTTTTLEPPISSTTTSTTVPESTSTTILVIEPTTTSTVAIAGSTSTSTIAVAGATSTTTTAGTLPLTGGGTSPLGPGLAVVAGGLAAIGVGWNRRRRA